MTCLFRLRWRPRRDEAGVAAVWTLIITVTVFTGLLGVVGGGGELINMQSDARRSAEQAARAAADELSASSVRSGSDSVDSRAAIARGMKVLADSGWDGQVQVTGSRVVVTAAGTRQPTFLTLLGVGSVRVSEEASADAISQPEQTTEP